MRFRAAYGAHKRQLQKRPCSPQYYSADIFTITPTEQVGSVEYGIKKKDLNDTYDINTINTTNDKVKIFRVKIDNTSGKVECFEVKGSKK